MTSLTSGLLQQPNVKAYFGSLLGLGFDSDRGKALSYTLLASTGFLSLASAYTTWVGLCEYLPGFIAFLLTLGVQGLLYASSWRLGGSLNTRAFRPSLLVIFSLTMATSVFFSYSALLNTVYQPAARQRDQLERAHLAATIIDADISARLTAEFHVQAKSVRESVRVWYGPVSRSLNHALLSASSRASEASAEHDRLTRRADRENVSGGTMVTIGGKAWITPSGRGDFTRQYESDADSYQVLSLAPAEQHLAALRRIEEGITRVLESILRDDSHVTPGDLVVPVIQT